MQPIKILLISCFDEGGGTGIAAKRLLDALVKNGVNAKMGVVEKHTNSPYIFELPKNQNFEQQNAKRNKKKLLKTTNPVPHFISKLSRIDVNFINKSDFDIIHLHWILCNTINIEDIAKIKKPIVWTMHDSWVFCGAEVYQNILEKDTRFIDCYKKENFPKTSSGIDICRLTWERKRKSWKNMVFHFVALCNKYKEFLANSALFKGQQATVIPNIIPRNIFKNQNKRIAKAYFDIPHNKWVIGFGANHSTNIKEKNIKGSWLLLNVLKKLKNKDNYFVVIFGKADDYFLKSIEKIGLSLLSTGKIEDPKKLSKLYNALDCFVCPSLIESFCFTAHEAMFCGVPICGFNTVGINECILHKQTGYLAKAFDAVDLANGIEYCLRNRNKLSKNSLARAKSDYFNEKRIVKKYLNVYEKSIG